jgi:hypothetical protein
MAAKYLAVLPSADQMNLYLKVAETFIYLTTSILSVTEEALGFIRDILSLIIRLPIQPPILQSSLVLLKSMKNQLELYNPLSTSCVEYTLKAICELSSVRLLACQTMVSIAESSPSIISITQLGVLRNIVQSSHLSFDELTCLSKTMGLVISALPSDKVNR